MQYLPRKHATPTPLLFRGHRERRLWNVHPFVQEALPQQHLIPSVVRDRMLLAIISSAWHTKEPFYPASVLSALLRTISDTFPQPLDTTTQQRLVSVLRYKLDIPTGLSFTNARWQRVKKLAVYWMEEIANHEKDAPR